MIFNHYLWHECILPSYLKHIAPRINTWKAYLPLYLGDPAFIWGPAFNRENTVSGLHAPNYWPTRVGKLKLQQQQTGWPTVGDKKNLSLFSPTLCQTVCQQLLCRSHTPTWVCQHEFVNFSLSCEGRFRPIVTSHCPFKERYATTF